MLRLVTIPLRILGRVAALGFSRLLFGFGAVLLLFVLFGDHPDRPGRLVTADAVVNETFQVCRSVGKRGSMWGACDDVERRREAKPDDVASSTVERRTSVSITFHALTGRSITARMPASHIDLPDTIARGDVVRIRYDRKRPNYIVGANSGGATVILLWVAISLAILLSAYGLWTVAGGWRLIGFGRAPHVWLRDR